ncbi:small multi-drug export protein [Paenibacillus sp. L3-i20]|uniref:small multi-drug export protein n=1 Tax=Paenibacillus sp. L3-i20 TaxID=2905833 RepID=UPI001EDFEA70|nr:small multi-drug export protein [Paenibacillus sp. L3-i20]GKU78979.1 hypothetical protein L3i20_v233760 [Paenibacillus sp. L3-i20]
MLLEYLEEWSYIAVFLLSAIPWVESVVVVPLGIYLGLDPIIVTILGFLGNWIVVLLIVMLFDRFNQWRARRRAAKYGPDDKGKEKGKKYERAHKVFVKYGLPGLAIIGPILIGTDIVAAFAMIFLAPRNKVILWMTIGLAFWSIVIGVVTHFGLDSFELIRSDLYTK